MIVVYEYIIGSWFFFSAVHPENFPKAQCIWMIPGTEEDGWYWRHR